MKFKDGDVAFEMKIVVTRDEERGIIQADQFFSTGNPFETMNILEVFYNISKVFVYIHDGYDNYDEEARKFLKEKYGKNWWHKTYKNYKSMIKAYEEVKNIWDDMKKKKIKVKKRRMN